MGELDEVLRAVRPSVAGPDGETLARLRADTLAAVGAIPDGAAAPAPGDIADKRVGPVDVDVLELAGAAAVPGVSRRRVVALVAAALLLVSGLAAVTIARRSAPAGIGSDDGWTAPTAAHLAPASRYRVTKLTDGSREVPFGVRLEIGLVDPPPGAGVGCRLVALPAGIGSASVVVDDSRVTSVVPCNVTDADLRGFLDALGTDGPTVEVRGDELRLRAGTRELDATRRTPDEPTTLNWTTPTLADLAGALYRVTSLNDGGDRPIVGQVWLVFGPRGDGSVGVVVSTACNGGSGAAAITDGRLIVEPMGSDRRGCSPDLQLQDELLTGLVQAAPKIDVRGTTIRLTAGLRVLEAERTSEVTPSAGPAEPTIAVATTGPSTTVAPAPA